MKRVAQKQRQNKRYLPHELTTKINSAKLYRQTKDIDFVLHRHHISKESLMFWNKLYNVTRKSFMAKSHRPHSRHPNAHTKEELSVPRSTDPGILAHPNPHTKEELT